MFDWMDTKGLNTEQALGKISRDILIDYNATTKTYNRLIRGLFFPFGRWYFSGSKLMFDYYMKHFIRATLGMASLPVIATALNNRSEEVREMERSLPDGLRNRTHIVIGKTPEGTIRTFALQLPHDALIGFKVFSVASNYANQVINNEIGIRDAATKTIKEWGVLEAKGLVYLTNPVVRFIRGLINDKDPYDNQPIYPVMESLSYLLTRYSFIDLYIYRNV